MKTSDTDARINRLIGQIEGIRRMINGGRAPADVVQQIMAARQALSRIGIILLRDEMIKITEPRHLKKVNLMLDKIFRV